MRKLINEKVDWWESCCNFFNFSSHLISEIWAKKCWYFSDKGPNKKSVLEKSLRMCSLVFLGGQNNLDFFQILNSFGTPFEKKISIKFFHEYWFLYILYWERNVVFISLNGDQFWNVKSNKIDLNDILLDFTQFHKIPQGGNKKVAKIGFWEADTQKYCFVRLCTKISIF